MGPGSHTLHTLLTGQSSSTRAFLWGSLGVLQLVCSLHLFASYIGEPKLTAGASMLPTLNARGDWVWVNKLFARGRGVCVGDLVSFKHPMFPGEAAVKRVLGMPGDYVMCGTPGEGGGGGGGERGGLMCQVPEGHCWVAGDNQPHSRDSRVYGPVPLGLVKGKVTRRVWPLGQAQKLGRGMEDVPGDRGFMKNR